LTEFEADQRVEGKRRAADDREHDALALLELEVAPEVGIALAEGHRADQDDEQQSRHLDQRTRIAASATSTSGRSMNSLSSPPRTRARACSPR
jgi:hypothetical protein